MNPLERHLYLFINTAILVTLVQLFRENITIGIVLYVVFGFGFILFMDVESDEKLWIARIQKACRHDK
jgi:hypothetical protein